MPNFGAFNLYCNPLKLQNHRVKKGLRRASVIQQNLNNLSNVDYLCTSCRKTLDSKHTTPDSLVVVNDNEVEYESENVEIDNTSLSISNNTSETEELSEELASQTSSLSQICIGTVLPVINEAICLLNESPIAKKHVTNHTYLENKVHKVYQNLNTHLGVIKESDNEANSKNFLEMIEKLKIKFNDSNTNRSEKIRILTLLPETWGLSEICNTIGCTKYMASIAKSLQKEKGVLSTPNMKFGRPLPNDIKAKILEFFIDDEISMNMPGMKDYLSIRNDDGKREHIQKRLILSNLKELYELFKIRYPDYRVGFSKFASLRPQHCVLAGSSRTHTICVCSMHQNVKLMMLGCNLATLTDQLATPLRQYNDCLKMTICLEPTYKCYFYDCDKCPGIHTLKNLLLNILDENGIDEIAYMYWISKPHTSLETFVKYSSDFVEDFCENIKSLLPHTYVAKQQANYLRMLKESLDENEYIVICDFAENYAFVIQNAASGFHWNNSQATIYPVVIYYKKNYELVHKSVVIISDCLSHDAVAVHEFTKITTSFIKELSSDAAKVFYFSDGAPQQFKNYKNFVNLSYHKEDFGLNAEWNYFATAHGKGPCDGVGGTVKRIAARASLQLPYDKQISTPQQLYDWAVKPNCLPNIHAQFFSNENYIQAKESLQTRYMRAKTITGTQKYHCVIPNGDETLRFKEFSSSVETRIYKIFKRVRK